MRARTTSAAWSFGMIDSPFWRTRGRSPSATHFSNFQTGGAAWLVAAYAASANANSRYKIWVASRLHVQGLLAGNNAFMMMGGG